MPDSSVLTDREIIHTRLLDAPREKVWRAWTDPAHVARWWGPDGFTNTVHGMDVRPGGTWEFIMHGPDGTDYPNVIRYEEVVAPEKLVYAHGGNRGDGPVAFHVTVTFQEQDGKTLLTMRADFHTPEELERVKAFGAVEGGQQTLAHLAAYLPTM